MTFEELPDLEDKYKDDPQAPHPGDTIPDGTVIDQVKLISGSVLLKDMFDDKSDKDWLIKEHSTRPFVMWVCTPKMG